MKIPHVSRGDLDGFFGLLVDNLLELMLIMVLCQTACGFSAAFVTSRILPGAAISILAGNIFYAWQARRLAARTGRKNVTALPFGLNTISLLAFVFMVMSPVYYETGDPDLAWKAGLAACFISGLIEIAGAFVGDWLRKRTPRAALLAGLAGVALSFMTLGFTFQVFAAPSIALIPMMFTLIYYGARIKLPLRLPGGLIAVVIGAGTAWVLKSLGLMTLAPRETVAWAFHLPVPALGELLSILSHPAGWSSIAVVAPIGLFNVISSIQNLESAEAAGDRYETRPSLLVNGAASLLAGFFGSPFPTTIYIGHPGWKAMGARTKYSTLSGAVIALLCLTGGMSAVLNIIPLEAALGVLIWIGMVIVAQAFQETERRHDVAVVLGLVPSLAAWALHIIETSLRAVGASLYDAAIPLTQQLYLNGILSLYQGFLLIAILLPAILAHAIDRKFLRAAGWSFAAAVFSAVGLIHAYEITPGGVQGRFGWLAAPDFALLYALIGVLLIGLHVFKPGKYALPDNEL